MKFKYDVGDFISYLNDGKVKNGIITKRFDMIYKLPIYEVKGHKIVKRIKENEIISGFPVHKGNFKTHGILKVSLK